MTVEQLKVLGPAFLCERLGREGGGKAEEVLGRKREGADVRRARSLPVTS